MGGLYGFVVGACEGEVVGAVDGGVDGHDVFQAKATDALETLNVLRAFYEDGGALFLTRYATNLPSFIGATGDDEWTTPNNCWGQNEDAAELCGGPWSFFIFNGQNIFIQMLMYVLFFQICQKFMQEKEMYITVIF